MIDGKNGIMNKMKYLQKIIFIFENTPNFMTFFFLTKKRFENKREISNALQFLPSHRSTNNIF